MNICPACGGAEQHFFARAWDAEYCTSEERFLYVECPRCRTVFLDPPPIERRAEIYPPNYYSFRGEGMDSLALRIKQRLDGRLFGRILAKTPGERLSVLDVGGGSGWLLNVARRQSPRVAETHEVDLDESARPAAEAAGHVFHCMPIETFTSDRSFDLIILLNLIEHVADPAAVLRKTAQLLSPGGFLLVKTPNTDTLDRRLFQSHNWGGFHCPRHWVLFTMPTFLDLAARCGLQTVWARYTQGAPQWTNSILGWLAEKGLVRIDTERPMHLHPLHAPLLAATAAVDFLRLPLMKTAQMFVLMRRA